MLWHQLWKVVQYSVLRSEFKSELPLIQCKALKCQLLHCILRCPSEYCLICFRCTLILDYLYISHSGRIMVSPVLICILWSEISEDWREQESTRIVKQCVVVCWSLPLLPPKSLLYLPFSCKMILDLQKCWKIIQITFSLNLWRVSCWLDALSFPDTSVYIIAANKDILLHSFDANIKLRKFTIIHCYQLIHRPYSNFFTLRYALHGKRIQSKILLCI